MKQTTNTLNFPSQITPVETPVSDFQLICEVKLLLTQKLNRVARGEYVLTENDKLNIINANDIFSSEGYPIIDVDLAQY